MKSFVVYQMKISKCKSVLISFFDKIVCKLVNVWMSYLMNIDFYHFFAKKTNASTKVHIHISAHCFLVTKQ